MDTQLDENPNDVTKQHGYALHVLFGAIFKILSSYVNQYKDKTPEPAKLDQIVQDLKGYHRTAEQLDMGRINENLLRDVEFLLERLTGEKHKRTPRKSNQLPLLGKTHVDDWLDNVYRNDPENVTYAKFFLHMHRWPAVLQMYFSKQMAEFKLFVTYEGKRWRCTGASRMGDVWLASNFDRENGYDKRVFLDDCSDWSKEP